MYGDALEEWPGHAPGAETRAALRYFYHGMITHHQAMLYNRAAIGSAALRHRLPHRRRLQVHRAEFVQEAQRTLYLDFPLCLFEAGGVSQRRVRLGRNEQFRIRGELALCR